MRRTTTPSLFLRVIHGSLMCVEYAWIHESLFSDPPHRLLFWFGLSCLVLRSVVFCVAVHDHGSWIEGLTGLATSTRSSWVMGLGGLQCFALLGLGHGVRVFTVFRAIDLRLFFVSLCFALRYIIRGMWIVGLRICF